ncbi:hypothetical protein AVEN_80284-1 [Araneus ventricosus]|uniref:C2H2-type domain-containing protein n=1 Tax=Araneus ventricosus TaxID=182803 RepID=A0A4Y2MJQ8_ARAVE|nr:hypothetical protein AVEN_80284-1 [Araneus ventricosus]
MLGIQETSSQIGKSSGSGSGSGVPLQVRSQMRVGVICVINDDVAFDDFASPACNEAMNAAELQSEWKIATPVWDEAPSTSSGYRGPASPERSQHFNEDQKCLVWCLIAHKLNNLAHNSYRVSHYTPHEQEIKIEGVECPVPLNKIPIVERLNNLRINVFDYEENEVFPLYVFKRVDEDCVNLLLIANEETQHYCLIRNMSRLLGDLTKHKSKHHYCYRCPHRFAKDEILKEHLQYCNDHSPQHIKMPAKGENFIKFQNVHYQHPLPYVINADFESLIVKKLHTSGNTEIIARHAACGYAYVIIGPDGRSVKPISVYRGKNAVQHFMENILKEKEELAAKLTSIVPIHMTPQDELDFRSATHCSICKKALKGDRVRDHDHQTGRYRAALHSSCNLKLRLSKKIPVVFHNLKNYDGHLIMQEIVKLKDYEISVVPTTMEKYVTFSLSKRYHKFKVSLNFVDSF